MKEVLDRAWRTAAEGIWKIEAENLSEPDACRAALAILAGADLTRWTVPEQYGGADTGELSPPDRISARAVCGIRGELAYHSGLFDVAFVMQGLGSYPLAMAASEELAQRVLPKVASGDVIPALALTEPGAGSSLGDVSTRAERTDSGWALTGHKTFISNAGIADFYSVLARTSGEPGDKQGLSMFFVPAAFDGLRAETFEVMAPHPIGDVYFNDVSLPQEHLIGEEGQGLELALGNLLQFRASVAAAANGFARRALSESIGHLRDRHQFGRPLATRQGLRFDLAEMDTRLRAAELLVEEAAEAVDEGVDATLQVARAKLFSTENASYVCDRAVQHFGGLGVKSGTIVERLYREVRALRIYEGTSEIQKLIIAGRILDND